MNENPRLHLDADTSRRRLSTALIDKGHDVTRTPNEWMSADATDEEQLLGATRQSRVIFTFNIADFSILAQAYQDHAGIVLANQRDWPLSRQIKALGKLLSETSPAQWQGQTRWLNEWDTL